ncbi:carbon-nitrogen family hydrolase [Rhodococcus zopfii]|uniref:Putative nitrilase/cyanide hydratase n=1 Tax=Rhodococcus sp. PY11 TaxID=551544 RepID=B5MAE0_9NOCA|nr:carbon-nitrogen family hydrolase [Rhodococcus zopfii]CAR47868.1 putative nitrilase/cyanide hydratase [Rhodococcus sp. PY11]
MSNRLDVRVLQVAYGDLEDTEARVARVAALVKEQKGADLIVLPELWPHGGFAFDQWPELAEELDGPTVQAMSAAARSVGATLHMGSIIERAAASASPATGKGMWNTSVVLGPDGSIIARYRKIHRFGFDVGEPTIIDAGDELVSVDLESARIRAGLATCYDLRFPEMFRMLLDQGAKIMVVPAAWPLSRAAHWKILGQARAVENQCFVIQCNTAGTHSGTTMGGHSQVIAPDGTVLAEAGQDEEVLSIVVDLDDVALHRSRFPVLRDRRLTIGVA